MTAPSLRSRCEAAVRAGREVADRDRAVSPLVRTDLLADVTAALGAPDPDPHDALVWSALATGDPASTGIEAVPVGRAWTLTGTVPLVYAPDDVRTLLVVSRSKPIGGRDRGVRVHRVAATATGVRLQPHVLVDGTPVRAAHLDAVEAHDADAVGPPRDATPALRTVLDTAIVLAAAEMLGAASAAMELAIDWVSRREQFGAPLATRQAVQHRIADMAIACDAVRALVDDTVARADAGAPWSREAAIAKLVASRRLPDVTAGAHQLHGGEGYYADRPLHRLHKRVLVLAHLFGGCDAPRRRLAAEAAAAATS